MLSPRHAAAVAFLAAVLRLGAAYCTDEIRLSYRTDSHQTAPHIDTLSPGYFVAVWTGDAQETGENAYTGVFGGVFNYKGVSYTNGDTQLNQRDAFPQDTPAVASLDRQVSNDLAKTNDFVAVWESKYQDSSKDAVVARLFHFSKSRRAIEPLTDEFVVNEYEESYQGNPTVASSPYGTFMVVWTSYGQDRSSYGIFAKVYNATTATPISGEIMVPQTTQGLQYNPVVSFMNQGGTYYWAVVWTGVVEGSSNRYHVFARLLDGVTGNFVTGEFEVDAEDTDDYIDHWSASVVPSNANEGYLIIAFESDTRDPDGTIGEDKIVLGVLGYDPTHGTLTDVLPDYVQINSGNYTSRYPVVFNLDEGTRVGICWHSYGQDHMDTNYGIYCRTVEVQPMVDNTATWAVTASDEEFRANLEGKEHQQYPSVASWLDYDTSEGIDPGDDYFVIAWQSENQDGDGYGVYGRVLDSEGARGTCVEVTPTPTTTPVLPASTSDQEDYVLYTVYALVGVLACCVAVVIARHQFIRQRKGRVSAIPDEPESEEGSVGPELHRPPAYGDEERYTAEGEEEQERTSNGGEAGERDTSGHGPEVGHTYGRKQRKLADRDSESDSGSSGHDGVELGIRDD